MVSEYTLSDIFFGKFSFLYDADTLAGKNNAINIAKEILKCTLCREPSDRTSNLGKLTYMFEDLEDILNEDGSIFSKCNISDSPFKGIDLEYDYNMELSLKNRQKQINGGKK